MRYNVSQCVRWKSLRTTERIELRLFFDTSLPWVNFLYSPTWCGILCMNVFLRRKQQVQKFICAISVCKSKVLFALWRFMSPSRFENWFYGKSSGKIPRFLGGIFQEFRYMDTKNFNKNFGREFVELWRVFLKMFK